ncbi:WYL domain-containing protein [Halosquirtibacter laminarini]|uniref:WYL domain-containing protein n=1 Tax=Halosquirtibacter laminarini TaxID=3374600 RepID=A0AC61NIZ1_9BACT|nr:WYL domain-containing protein [Prolixibacteraceae bacterium]
MSSNKHANIRYNVLDRCFRDYKRKYFWQDLLKECNKELELENGCEGIKRRQLLADIKFMESEQGWNIPLARFREDRKVYYRYSDMDFSIAKRDLNPSEITQLGEILTVLSRFKGMPKTNWLEELKVRLEDTFLVKSSSKESVSFDENEHLRGLDYFGDLFQAISREHVLSVLYREYEKAEVEKLEVHPWFLKQYNNRWFLLGYVKNKDRMWNLPLDRILSYERIEVPYITNESISMSDYYKNVVGVTVYKDAPVEHIVAKVNMKSWNYIESKPIHSSQKLLKCNGDYVLFSLDVSLNYEVRQHLFYYMDSLELLEPAFLREEFKERIDKMHDSYHGEVDL